ncbi:unnamed protein product [Echinostoma caproni]|uniref:Enoyl-CoA hydratase domain-containing protein 3, mitochondrial n=1 Tax=Echinostoma caproni TaxID=27848 RepID=A0A183ATS2_9TREM|nr:unnamed protein product [Echinostoma caproni]
MYNLHRVAPTLLCSIRCLSSNPARYVLSERVDSCIQILTLNDEKRANCLSFTLIGELHNALLDVQRDQDVRALIIRGAGRFFSAGHDLNEMGEGSTAESRSKLFQTCTEMMQQLARLPVPSIAAIRGPAFAAGCQLVAACDLAVAGEMATFSTPGVKLGLFCSTPGVPLVRAIGVRAAKELLLTGRTINAQRAYELGLIHRLVPDDQVLESALALAREITQHSKPVVSMGKQTLDKQAALESIDEAYSVAAQTMLDNLELEDTKRGIQSFIRKRSMPKWTHKSN